MSHISSKASPNQPVSSDLYSRNHYITFFSDDLAFSKDEEEWTLPDLAGEILDRSASRKDRLPWLKMARFGDKRSKKNCLRHNANTTEVTGVEIDYDAGVMTFDAAVAAMRGAAIRCLLYTSPSYKAGTRERWRILVPLSEGIDPSLREGIVESVNAIIGGVAARESFVISTAFFYGCVDGNETSHRVELLDGDFIDQRPDLLAKKTGKPPIIKADRAAPVSIGGNKTTPGRSEEEIAVLLKASRKISRHGEKQWHNAMLSVTASMIGKGWTDAQIYDACAPYCDHGFGDDDIAELIKSGREKWQTPDADKAIVQVVPAVAAAVEAKGAPQFEPNWRERTRKGVAVPSMHNARLAIIASGFVCSEDAFHNRMFIGRSDAASPSERIASFCGEVTDGRIMGLRVYLSDRYGFDLTEKHVRDAVLGLAGENTFDPVCDMLAEAQASWDGVKRLDRMAIEYFNCDDTELNRVFVRKTMIAAVARARRPGCKFDTILIMESPEGKMKSSAWAVLAGDGNFSDEPIIGKSGREVMEQLKGVWIHENADLAGMKKADVDAVKSFASRQVDRARPAYGHFLVEQPRRSIEVGTTNARRYMLSQTGNRRFWPIVINSEIDLARLRAARLQLWGEAAAAEAAGESLVLDRRLWDVAAIEQEERRAIHPWEPLLIEMTEVPFSGPVTGMGYLGNGVVHQVAGEERVATRVIFEHVIKVPVGQMHNGHSKTLADIMRRLGWREGVFKLEGKTTRGYVRKVSE